MATDLVFCNFPTRKIQLFVQNILLCPQLEDSQHAAPHSPVVPNIHWQIIQRDNNRSACFHENSDYQHLLETLAEQAARLQCSLHA